MVYLKNLKKKLKNQKNPLRVKNFIKYEDWKLNWKEKKEENGWLKEVAVEKEIRKKLFTCS